MSTPDTGRTEQTTTPHFCGNCGAVATGQRFCANCGAPAGLEPPTERIDPFEGHRAKADRVAADVRTGYIPTADELFAPEPAPARRGRGLTIGLFIGTVVLLGAAAALIVALGVFSSSDARSAYAHKVGVAFAPLTRANQQVSSALTHLHGKDSPATQQAVAAAASATSATRGALSALNVPSGSHQLATTAQQALDRETSYLTGLNGVLQHPTNAAASQLQSLAGNLTTALDAVGDPIAGASQSVSGDGAVVSWAQRASKPRAASGGSQSQQQGSGSSTAPSPLTTGRNCGGTLYAGPNTTCAFAEAVRQAYHAGPGLSPTLEVTSPVTGGTYTMNCSPAGGSISCAGGNDASVAWTP